MLPIAIALRVVAELRHRLRLPGGVGRRLAVVGSVRRGAPTAKDIDVLVVVGDAAFAPGLLPGARLGGAGRLALGANVVAGGRHRTVRASYAGYRFRLDLFMAKRSELPFALFHLTGPRSYNIRTRRLARLKHLKLNQYGMHSTATGRRIGGIHTEKRLAHYLGLHYRPPANRR
jgi:DNA polymerase/3'-5' exonuclease PolX